MNQFSEEIILQLIKSQDEKIQLMQQQIDNQALQILKLQDEINLLKPAKSKNTQSQATLPKAEFLPEKMDKKQENKTSIQANNNARRMTLPKPQELEQQIQTRKDDRRMTSGDIVNTIVKKESIKPVTPVMKKQKELTSSKSAKDLLIKKQEPSIKNNEKQEQQKKNDRNEKHEKHEKSDRSDKSDRSEKNDRKQEKKSDKKEDKPIINEPKQQMKKQNDEIIINETQEQEEVEKIPLQNVVEISEEKTEILIESNNNDFDQLLQKTVQWTQQKNYEIEFDQSEFKELDETKKQQVKQILSTSIIELHKLIEELNLNCKEKPTKNVLKFSQITEQSLQLIENDFIQDLLANNLPDAKIFDIFQVLFIILNVPMPKKEEPNFWTEVKSYLKKNETTFSNILFDLKNKDFTIFQLMNLEDLITQYPHVIQSAAYEEMDALSCALSFLVQDFVISMGLIREGEEEKFDLQARQHYLFQKSQVLENKHQKVIELIQNLDQ